MSASATGVGVMTCQCQCRRRCQCIQCAVHSVNNIFPISAPSPPTRTGVRTFSKSQLVPTPHIPAPGVLSTVKDTLGSVKENVRKYVNTVRHKEENLDDIPEVESS